MPGWATCQKARRLALADATKLQFSVCIVFLVKFTISVEGNWGEIGRLVRLAVYRHPQMVNAGWGDAPKGASPSLG